MTMFSSPFFAEAVQAARDSGLDVSTPSNVRLVVIYAGNLYLGGGGLNPNAGRANLLHERAPG